MKYLDPPQLLEIYLRIVRATGGLPGVRDSGALASAIAQPRASFDGQDLYSSLVEKAAALGFSLIKNHPFVDGNKRIAFAATDAMLRRNGFRISGSDEEVAEQFLALAAGAVDRAAFTAWLTAHILPRSSTG